MKTWAVILFGMLWISVAGPAVAQQDQATQAEKAKSEAIDPQVVNEAQGDADFVSSFQQVQKAMDAFAEAQGITYGVENNKGQRYYSAIATVPVEETNPNWAKWRAVAYDRALLKIQQNFIENIYGELSGETLRKYVSDDSSNQLDFPEPDDAQAANKWGAIWEKLTALTGAKLDQALKELNVDPEQFEAAAPEQKKTLFRDNFIETSVTKAAGELNGLIPVKTFSGVDSKGGYTIGVVAMYYGKLKQLADDIVNKRKPMLQNTNGKPLSAYIPEKEEVLADTFGVRVVFTPDGVPAILSYGQWSYMYKGQSRRRQARGHEHAQRKAKTESQKQIANFLQSQASYKQIEETAAKEETIATKVGDGDPYQQDHMAMIDTIKSQMRVKYETDLQGIRPVKRWSYKHPSGHEIIGVVSAWTLQNMQSAQDVKNWESDYQDPDAEQSAPKADQKRSRETGVSEGAGMDLDF